MSPAQGASSAKTPAPAASTPSPGTPDPFAELSSSLARDAERREATREERLKQQADHAFQVEQYRLKVDMLWESVNELLWEFWRDLLTKLRAQGIDLSWKQNQSAPQFRVGGPSSRTSFKEARLEFWHIEDVTVHRISVDADKDGIGRHAWVIGGLYLNPNSPRELERARSEGCLVEAQTPAEFRAEVLPVIVRRVIAAIEKLPELPRPSGWTDPVNQ